MAYRARMCTNFTPVWHTRWLTDRFGVTLPPHTYPAEVFPGYLAPIAVRAPDAHAVNQRIDLARFGLIAQ